MNMVNTKEYTLQDYYGITERYVIHEYDTHKKDKPWWYISKKQEKQTDTRPVYDTEKLFKNVDYSEQAILDKLNYPKSDKTIQNVLSLLNTLKYTTETGRYVHAIPISTTNKLNVDTVGSQRTMSRTLQFMQYIGLTACVDPTYRHHASNSDYNRCRLHVLNKKMQAVLLKIQKDYNIKPRHITRQNYLCSSVEVDMNKVNMLYNKIYISSNLHVKNPFNSREELEKYATYIIQKKYPQYVELVKKAREVNAKPFYLTNYILQVKTTINFEYSPTRHPYFYRI